MSRGPTAFVLAGGGSLGAIEVGMLRALLEAGVLPDLVVGSSVGALNAVYFAEEPTPENLDALARVWLSIRRENVFPFSASRGALALLGRRSSFVSPDPLRRLVDRNLPDLHLEETAIPCHVVATDLMLGDEVVFSEGPALDALLASTAIPGVFPPVTAGGRTLIDGGVASNTPIATAAGLGATRIVVLPTGAPCALAHPPETPVAVALQALNVLIARQLHEAALRLAGAIEIRVIPPLCPLACSAYDFSQTATLIARGDALARDWLRKGGLDRDELPAELVPHGHGGMHEAPH